jgi:hypothetical protein
MPVGHREKLGSMAMEYNECGGTGWVCEDHENKPWAGSSISADACACGGAGIPCLVCNRSDPDNQPRMPDGYKTILHADGWKH